MSKKKPKPQSAKNVSQVAQTDILRIVSRLHDEEITSSGDAFNSIIGAITFRRLELWPHVLQLFDVLVRNVDGETLARMLEKAVHEERILDMRIEHERKCDAQRAEFKQLMSELEDEPAMITELLAKARAMLARNSNATSKAVRS